MLGQSETAYQLPPLAYSAPMRMASDEVANLLSNYQVASTVSNSPVPLPELTLEQETEALERERQMLEERVRELMWLVQSLEGQQAEGAIGASHASVSTGPTLESISDSSALAPPAPPSPSGTNVTTSTERAVTYLPYLR